MLTAEKIKALDDLVRVVEEHRARKQTVVHCHGDFDLLHIGHIRHLQKAHRYGDVLVVTVTPDPPAGEGRTARAFEQQRRAEGVASLACVDYVAIGAGVTAVEAIERLRPDVYVRGAAGEAPARDGCPGAPQEREAVARVGGRFVVADEDASVVSGRVDHDMVGYSAEVTGFLSGFRERYRPEAVSERLDAVRTQRVLTIGETIIDEYQFCDVMAKSNKDPVLAARHLYVETYAGGILAIANHLANFCENVSVLSFLGDRQTREAFVREKLNPAVTPHFFHKADSPTIVKRRLTQEYMAVKLFEVYDINTDPVHGPDEDTLLEMLDRLLPQVDVVVVADYGHGLFTERAIQMVCDRAPFLAVNVQTNAGNRGFNLVSKYPRADYVSIDEPEARLETRDRKAAIDDLIEALARKMSCPRFVITRGKRGTVCYDAEQGLVTVPAFSVSVVDRIGAGDAFLALTAPCVAMGMPMELVGFIGNVVGAEACAIMGNKRAVDAGSVRRRIATLLA